MSALLSSDRPEAPLFSDGIGDRVVSADAATGDLVQVLRINPALTAVPSFEFALRERVARLANFRHGYYARVRRVDRTHAHATALSVVSDHVEGTRLSDILRVAGERGLQLDINAAVCLIRQLVPAVALLHENARDVAHGLIAPERLIVTPHARLVIAEHVMGAAIEQMQYGRERLWHEFRIAMPPSAGIPRFDQRSDVAGIGVVALSLVLGRPLTTDEYPRHLNDLLDEAVERTALGDAQPLSAAMRAWLARTLQVDVRRAFSSAPESLTALEQLAAEGADYVAAPVALETFLSRYIAAVLSPAPPAAAVSPRPLMPVQPAAAAQPAPSVLMPPPAPAAAPAPSAAPAPVAAPAPAATPAPPAAAFAAPAAPVVPISSASPRASAPAPIAAAPVPPAAHEAPAGTGDPMADDLAQLLSAARADAAQDAPTPLFNPDQPFGSLDVESTFAPSEPPMAGAGTAPPKRSARRWIVAAAVMVVLASGGYAGFKMYPGASAPPAMATLSVQSNPPGVSLFVDGVDRGMTPARVTLAAGPHILELRGRGVPRVIPITLTAGADVSQYLEFVESTPPDQPMTVADTRSEAVASAPVPASATADASSAVPSEPPAPPAAPLAGWITVKLPFSVEIREGGRLLGTTAADRLMLAAGKHELEFANETLAFRVVQTVQVVAGKVTPVAVELPNGVVNLNATPWAEVWIDGQRVGETPIGNLSVPIGAHEIVFRHPQLGEKRHAVSVTAGVPVRLSIDMK